MAVLSNSAVRFGRLVFFQLSGFYLFGRPDSAVWASLIFFSQFASRSIPFLNWFFYWGLPRFGLTNFMIVHSHCVTSSYFLFINVAVCVLLCLDCSLNMSSNMIHQKKEEEKKEHSNNLFFKSTLPLLNHISYQKLPFPAM